MFCLSESDTFYLYPYPTDMRKSFYSLSGIVTNEMKRDVQDGEAFIFVNRLKFDFEGMDLTDEEKRQIEEASRKVTESRKVRVREHEKQMPVRKKLPENLRHVEEHIYPDGYLGHEDEWILFNDVETSEHLEITAPDAYVRVTIRHKAMRKSDNKILTATAPAEPLAKSYAGPTALPELTIGKFADHLPFYRQIEMFKRIGIELKQPTVEGWFFGIADLMHPMYYRLQEYMLQLDYQQSDKWLNHFFTHIHEYDNDYSRDLLELLPHNLKQKGIL